MTVLLGNYYPHCYKSIDRLTECLLGICIFLLSQKTQIKKFSQEGISVLNYWCLIVQVQHEKRQEEKLYLRDSYHSTGMKCDVMCALHHMPARPIWTESCNFSSHPQSGCAVKEWSHHLSSCPISILAKSFSIELIQESLCFRHF